MLRTAIDTGKRWYGKVVLGKSPIELMSKIELDREIRLVEQKKNTFEQEMRESKSEYDAKLEEAKTADQTTLPELKVEASHYLNKYEQVRPLWLLTLNYLQFLNRAALNKEFNSGIESINLDLSPEDFNRLARRYRQKIESRERHRAEIESANEQLQGMGPGMEHMDSVADQRVEAAIEAARQGDDVPTLDELAETNGTEAPNPAPRPADGPGPSSTTGSDPPSATGSDPSSAAGLDPSSSDGPERF